MSDFNNGLGEGRQSVTTLLDEHQAPIEAQREHERQNAMLGATAESFGRVRQIWTESFQKALDEADANEPVVAKKQERKTSVEDMATFWAVRNGKIKPTSDNLPYIISSYGAVLTNGAIKDDTTGTRFMNLFAEKTNDEKHIIAEGYNYKENTWTPEAVFKRMSAIADDQMKSAAEIEFSRDENLKRRGLGLGANESYNELSHERQMEVCNNISSLLDKDWVTTSVDNALRSASNTYSAISDNDVGQMILSNVLNGVGLKGSQVSFIDDFKKTGLPLTEEGLAQFIYDNGSKYGFVDGEMTIGGNGVSEGRYKEIQQAYAKASAASPVPVPMYGGSVVTPTFDEKIKAVKGDDGKFHLEYKNGGKLDGEFLYKNVVMNKFIDEDGRFTAIRALNALNANPEAWSFVDRFTKNYKGNYDVINDYGFNKEGMLSDLLEYYEKNSSTPEGKAHAESVIDSVMTAIEAIDKRTGAYSEDGDGWFLDGAGRMVAGSFNAIMNGGFEGVIKPIGNWAMKYTWDLTPWANTQEKIIADFAGRHTSDSNGCAEVFARRLSQRITQATNVQYFSDNTIVGSTAEFFAEIGMIGKLFKLGSFVAGEIVTGTGSTLNAIGKANRIAKDASIGYKAYRATRIAGLSMERFGKLMAGSKDVQKVLASRKLAGDLLKTEKNVAELAKSGDSKALVEQVKEYDNLLAKWNSEYRYANPAEVDKFVTELASFIGKIPTAAYMYDDAVDRNFAIQMMDTTVADDGEFTKEERDALMNYARGKGLVSAIMMSGSTHFALGNMRRAFKTFDKLSPEATRLERYFDKLCKGETGLVNNVTGKTVLDPSKYLFWRVCLGAAISRASKSAWDNASFVFTMGEAETIIENNRKIWEKQNADPNFKPTIYDRLRGSVENLWEAGKVGLQAGIPTGFVGFSVAASKGLTKNVKERIANTRYWLALKEFESKAKNEDEASVAMTETLLALSDARGDKNRRDAIFSEIKKKIGIRGAALLEQLEYQLSEQRTDQNIDLRSQLEMMKAQHFSEAGIKGTLNRVGFKNATVKMQEDGRALVTIPAGEYAGTRIEKPINILVANERVKHRDKKGNWAHSWVNERVTKRDSATFNEMFDAMTKRQQKRVLGFKDERGIVHAPENINGILTAAEKETIDRGVYLPKEDVINYGYVNEDVNLIDGMIVLSNAERAVSDKSLLASLDGIVGQAKARGIGGDIETFLHEYFHAITDLLPFDAKTKADLKAKYERVDPKTKKIRAWTECFVDDFLANFVNADQASRAAWVSSNDNKGILAKIGDAVRKLRSGIDPRSDSARADASESAPMEEFIREMVKESEGYSEAKSDADIAEANAEARIKNTLGEGEFSSSSVRDYMKRSIKPTDGIDSVFGKVEKMEKEISDGKKQLDIIPDFGGNRGRAVAVHTLRDGRNLFAGASILANRMGTTEKADLNSSNEASNAVEAWKQIVAYAKKGKRFYGNLEGTLVKAGYVKWRKGSEAQCWINDGANKVVKAIDPAIYHCNDPRLILNRIMIHNMVSPDTAMKLIGFTEYEGSIRPVVMQNLIREGEYTFLPKGSGFLKSMKNLGFEAVTGEHVIDITDKNEVVFISKDRNFILADLHNENVLIDKNGGIHIIDMVANLNTPWFRYANGPFDEKYAPEGQMSYDEMMGIKPTQSREALIESMRQWNIANGFPEDFGLDVYKSPEFSSGSSDFGKLRLGDKYESNRATHEPVLGRPLADTDRGVSQAGKDGRGNPDYIARRDNLIKSVVARGRDMLDGYSVGASDFHDAMKNAMYLNKNKTSVTLKDVSEYADAKCFLFNGGMAGIAVMPDGDVVSVFKNPQSSNKMMTSLIMTALDNGGTKLDCFNGYLPQTYSTFGFKPVCRIKFNREFAPEGWDYAKKGEPDVIFMVHNGDGVETVAKRLGKYDVFLPDLQTESIPLIEAKDGVDEYTRAAAYRDSILSDMMNGTAFCTVGANGLTRLCGERHANKILNEARARFFNEFLTIVNDPMNPRADVRKRIDLSEINKNIQLTGKNRMTITTKNGTKLPVAVFMGGTGYLGGVRKNGLPNENDGKHIKGDAGFRIVIAGDSKPNVPYAMLNGFLGGKKYTVKDFFKNNDSLAEAYPELMTRRVFLEGTKQYDEYKGSYPEHADEKVVPDFGKNNENGYILVNSVGDVVISKSIGDGAKKSEFSNRIIEGIGGAFIKLIQREERWESDVTRNNLMISMVIQGKKNLEGLGRFLKSEMNAEKFSLNFRLGDNRLIEMVNEVIDESIPKYIENRKKRGLDLPDGMELEAFKGKLKDSVLETVRNSARFFAAEIEARNEAMMYGLSESDLKLLDYAKRQEQMDNALTMIDSNHVSRQEQTRRVLDFWRKQVVGTVAGIMYTNESLRQYRSRNGIESPVSEMFDTKLREYFKKAYDAMLGAQEQYVRDANRFDGLSVEKDYTGVSKGSGKSATHVVATEGRIAEESLTLREKVVSHFADIAQERGPSALGEAETIAEAIEMYKKVYNLGSEIGIRRGEGAWDELTKLEQQKLLMSMFKDALHEVGVRKDAQWRDTQPEFSTSSPEEKRLRLENKKLGAKLARAQKRQMRERAIRSSEGMTLAELNERIGVDAIGQIIGMYDETSGTQIKTAKQLANEIESASFTHFIGKNPEWAGQPIEKLQKNPIAVAEFGATVASFLTRAANKCSFGRVRQSVRSDVMKIRRYFSRPDLEVIRGLLVSDIDAMNEQRRRIGRKAIIDNVRKTINKDAMGRKTVDAELPLFKRKVAPRVQQYWRFVSDVLDMPIDVRLNELGEEARDKNGKRLTAKTVAERIKEIQDKWHFGEDEYKWIEGSGDENIDPIDETKLLKRDLARLELTALTRYGGLAHKQIGEIADAVEHMAFDIETRAQMIENIVGPRTERDEANVNALVGGCNAFRKSEKRGNAKLSASKEGWRRALYFNTPDLFRRLKMYFPEGSEAALLCDDFCRDMSLAHINMEKLIADNESTFRDKVIEVFGKSENFGGKTFEEIMKKLLCKNDAYSKFSRTGWSIPHEGAEEVEVTIDGKTRVVKKAVGPDDSRFPKDQSKTDTKLSLGDLIYIWAARNQEDMLVNNAIYGFDAAKMAELGETIGAEGREIASWITHQYELQREAISEISERVSGMPVLSPDINYCPLSFIGDPDVVKATRFSIDMFPAFLTRRQNHDIKNLREDRNIFDVFSKRIQDTAHYVAFTDIIDRVKTTFGDARVRKAYSDLLGNGSFNAMYTQLYEALSGGVREPSGLFGRIRNFTTATTLFLNIPSAIKQFEGVAAYSSVMGVKHWAGDLFQIGRAVDYIEKNIDGTKTNFGKLFVDAQNSIGNPFETRKNEGYSDIIRGLKDAEDAMAEDKPWTNNWASRKYYGNGLAITTKIDSLSTMSMAGAFFNMKVAEHRKQGYSMEDAKRMAIADLDYNIQLTQQSARREFQIDIQNNKIGKLLTQFAGPSYVRLGMEIEALHRALYVEKGEARKKAFKNLANKLVALHVVCPTALSLLNFGAQSIVHKADDDDWAKRCVRDWVISCALGPFSGMFIGGSLATYAAQKIWSKGDSDLTAYRGGGSPMLSKLMSLCDGTFGILSEVSAEIMEGDIDAGEVGNEVVKLLDALLPIFKHSKNATMNIIDAVN